MPETLVYLPISSDGSELIPGDVCVDRSGWECVVVECLTGDQVRVSYPVSDRGALHVVWAGNLRFVCEA